MTDVFTKLKTKFDKAKSGRKGRIETKWNIPMEDVEKSYEKITSFSNKRLRNVCSLSGPIRGAKRALRQGVYKGEIQWKPKFVVKCEECGKEFDEEVDYCDRCMSPQLGLPDETQQERYTVFFKKVNELGQNFRDVLLMHEDEINTVDKSYLFFEKEYAIIPSLGGTLDLDERLLLPHEVPENEKFPEGTILRAIRSVKSEYVGRNMNKVTKAMNLDERVCPLSEHRGTTQKKDYCEMTIDGNKCGIQTLDAYWEVTDASLGYGKKMYLSQNELVEDYYYSTDPLLIEPPPITIYKIAMAVMGMNDQLFQRFHEMQVPRQWIILDTDNIEVVEDQREYLRECAEKGVVAVTGIRRINGRGDFAKVINLTSDSVADLSNKEARHIVLEEINRVYGLSDVVQSDTSTSGGLNSEREQLTVKDETIQSKQAHNTLNLYSKCHDIMFITDWLWEFIPSEQETALEIAERKEKNVSIATQMVSMGFDAYLDDPDEMDFKFEGYGHKQTFEEMPFGDEFGGDSSHDEMEEEGQEDEAETYEDEPNEKASTKDEGLGQGGRGRGVPKTETERRQTHRTKYGNDKIPKRGTGLQQNKHIEKIDKAFDNVYSLGNGTNHLLDSIIKDTIKEGFENRVSSFKMMENIESTKAWKDLAEELNLTPADIRYKLKRIIRQERLNLRNEAFSKRYESIDENDPNFKFILGGPPASDPDTCDICKKIMAQIPEEGVVMSKFKALIDEFGDPKVKNPTTFTIHLGTRHAIRRKTKARAVKNNPYISRR